MMSSMEPVPSAPPARAAPRGLLPQLVWEAVLLVAAVVALTVALRIDTGQDPSSVWTYIAVVGLLASGFAASLRTGTPNLAIGAVAALAGVLFVGLAGSLPEV